MSRAYCLTCNEQVHETAGGTCPLGHPVTPPDRGPEPWVGFAAPTTTGWADGPVDDHDVAMEHLGVDGRHVAHAGVNGHAGANGSVIGSVNGHALGGGHGNRDPFPSTFGHHSTFPSSDAPAEPTGPGPAADDDLAALLAEALHGAEAPDQAPEDATPDAPADTASEDWGDDDWGDLTSLSAELQLDADQGWDDGPAASEHAPPATPIAEPSAFDEASIDSADIDELLAELTGSAPEAPAAAPDAPPAAPEPPPAPAPEATTPPPPPPVARPLAEPVPVSDSIPPLDDLRSPPPTAEEPPGLWDETDLDHGVDHEPAPPVDLTNFTARGRRVGGSGGATPRRRLGRKKKG